MFKLKTIIENQKVIMESLRTVLFRMDGIGSSINNLHIEINALYNGVVEIRKALSVRSSNGSEPVSDVLDGIRECVNNQAHAIHDIHEVLDIAKPTPGIESGWEYESILQELQRHLRNQDVTLREIQNTQEKERLARKIDQLLEDNNQTPVVEKEGVEVSDGNQAERPV